MRCIQMSHKSYTGPALPFCNSVDEKFVMHASKCTRVLPSYQMQMQQSISVVVILSNNLRNASQAQNSDTAA